MTEIAAFVHELPNREYVAGASRFHFSRDPKIRCLVSLACNRAPEIARRSEFSSRSLESHGRLPALS